MSKNNYRTEPELDRGCAVFFIRSLLFVHNNTENGLAVAYAYHYSDDVDVASEIKEDPVTGIYYVSKYKRITSETECDRAILDLYETLRKMELKNHIPRIKEEQKFFYEFTPKVIRSIKKDLQGSVRKKTYKCPQCGYKFTD